MSLPVSGNLFIFHNSRLKSSFAEQTFNENFMFPSILVIHSLLFYTLGFWLDILRQNDRPNKNRRYHTRGTNGIPSLKKGDTSIFYYIFIYTGKRYMTTFLPINPLSALNHDTMIVFAQCLKSQESRIRLDGIQSIAWLNICAISVSVLLNLDFILLKIQQFLKKNDFMKYTNIRQNTVHVIFVIYRFQKSYITRILIDRLWCNERGINYFTHQMVLRVCTKYNTKNPNV